MAKKAYNFMKRMVKHYFELSAQSYVRVTGDCTIPNQF